MNNKYNYKNIFILISYLCIFDFFNLHAGINEFIPNLGQWNAPFDFKTSNGNADIFFNSNQIKFLCKDPNNNYFLHGNKMPFIKDSITFKYHSYQIDFLNLEDVKPHFSKKETHYYNYFLGSDPQRWKSEVYPCKNADYYFSNNIRIHYYTDNSNIKYDITFAIGAKIENFKMKYSGIDKLELNKKNELLVHTSVGVIKENIPYSYQIINGEKVEVECKYKLSGDIIEFVFPRGYNKLYDLIVDPTIIFCTFTGSTADNWGFTATYDTMGNFFAGGIVVNDQPGISTNLTGAYPVTIGAIQTTYGGGNNMGANGMFPTDCAFSKFGPSGGVGSLIYATYFGGLLNEQPHSIIVDHAGNLLITGRTFSDESTFPLTGNAYDNTYNGGGDMFVAKFNSTGTLLLGSTYIGGSSEESVNIYTSIYQLGSLKHNYADDARSEIIVDNNNNVYVASCTKSSNFPTTPNAIQNTLAGNQDGIVIELSQDLSTLIWSTYIGGTLNDAAYSLTFNKQNQNELYVVGGTESSNFPSTIGTINSNYQGGSADGFILRFNSVTKALVAGSFIGTNQYDQIYGVQTDDSNRIYIVGQTQGNYPVTPGVFVTPNSSQFISILNNSLSTYIHSTVFGKGSLISTDLVINAFLVDNCQNIYVSGWGGPVIPGNPGNTVGLVTTPNALQNTTDGSDFYFYVLSKNCASLQYASFFGQSGGGGEHVDGGTSRFDKNGVIYQAICSACGGGTQNFPVTPGAYSTTKLPNTNCNLAALKISFDLQNPNAVASTNGPLSGCVPFLVNFLNNSTSATNYTWNFGDGSPLSNAVSPSHTFTSAGTFTVTLVASNPNGCTQTSDTTKVVITVKDDSLFPGFTYVKVDSCNPFSIQITNTSTYNNGIPSGNATYNWDFGDGTTFTGQFPPLHNFPNAATYTVTLTMTDPNACNNPATFQVVVDFSTSLVIAAFNMPDSVCMPALISFLDQSTNATTWNWSFGDGNTSTIPNPTNNYTTPGTYTVYLVSGNPNTCNKFDSISKVITVMPSPTADFTWTPNPPEPNVPNVFTNLSVGATKYLWDFGDGETDTVKNPIHIYDKDGTYTVCLTATNEYGCRDTVCKSVRGMVIPLVDVPTGFSPNGDGINDILYVKGYGIENMVFRIFNRWGEKIFESKDKKIGWDGRYNTVMQEMEVYAYTLYVEFFDGTKTNKKGNVTLLK